MLYQLSYSPVTHIANSESSLTKVARHILVIGDSLTFHGPDTRYPPGEPGLWPNVVARELSAHRSGASDDWTIDLYARMGWTTRDAWWAVTKDPNIWGTSLPRSEAVILAVGGMDALPSAMPTWLREGIPYVRPASVRRRVRTAYTTLSPRVIQASGGRFRQLSQTATDHYLRRIVQVIRLYYPDLPIFLMTPPGPYQSPMYPVVADHASAVTAARQFGERESVTVLDVEQLVNEGHERGDANPDGIHWSWSMHEQAGQLIGQTLIDHGVTD